MLRRASILVAALAVATTGPIAAAQAPQPAPAAAQGPPVAEMQPAAVVAEIDADPDARRRGLLVRRLASLGGDDATEAADALLASLGNASAPARVAAGELAAALTVTARPEPAWTPVLATMLRGGSSEAVRRDAAIALAAIGMPRGTGVLVDAAAAGNAVPTQTAAAAGLALVPEPQAVTALAGMLGETHLPETRRAAAAALAELSGVDLSPTDVDAWRAWASGVLRDEPGALRNLLQEAAAKRARLVASQLSQAEATVARLARERYEEASGDRRRTLLADYLGDADASVRLAGGRIVLENVGLGELPSAPVVALIRAATADPDPRVRRLSARLIRDGGDGEGVRLVLTRLPRDEDAATRLSMLRSVAPLADASMADALLGLAADDASGEVRATAGATAARVAAEAGDDALVRRVSRALQGLLAEAGDESTRRGVREALSRLPDASLTSFWIGRLRELGPGGVAGETATALRGLASTADPRAAGAADSFLAHPDTSVRVAAVRAVAATGGFARMTTLQPLFDPPDGTVVPPPVSDAARSAFLQSLGSADNAQLAVWPDRLRNAELRLIVLEELANRARQAAGNPASLAHRLHEVADLLAGPLDRPGEAAPRYEEALRLELDRQEAQTQGNPSSLSSTASAVSRVDGAIISRLRAGDLDGARQLSAEVARRRPSLASDVGASVRRAAERLTNDGRRDDARAAVQAALSWDPPLDPLTRRNLNDLLGRLGG